MNSVHLEIALLAHKLGFSPVPPREDGSKAPIGEWKEYQKTPASTQVIRVWYRDGRTGNGLVCGVGCLECFEFDDGATFNAFLEAAWAVGLGELVARIRVGYEESTPGGGVHWLYRCDTVGGNTKLACRHKTPEEFTDSDRTAIEKATAAGKEHKPVKTLIETRGKGGFVITAPSNGKVHPTGGVYEIESGGLESIIAITAEERASLWGLARTFDQMPVAKPSRAKPKTTAAGNISPGDDFEDRATWEEILEPFGWTKVHASGDVIYWRRPGKDEGWSATTGYCKGLKVFSSSTLFSTDTTYTKFGAYTLLNHGNDYTAAAKALVEKGYGQPSWAWRGQPPHPGGPLPGGGVTYAPGSPVGITDDEVLVPIQKWPDPLASNALHALAGMVVNLLAPATEADPAALLLQFIVGFGNAIGRDAWIYGGGGLHFANEFNVNVGNTSRARKGTSWKQIRRILAAVDPAWVDLNITSGLSTGEGLIWNIRDEILGTDKKTKQEVVVDPGIADKRLLAVEGEFGNVLRCFTRENNTLSGVMRLAFDGDTLRTMTKNNPARASNPHFSLIGHITQQELTAFLSEVEVFNGMGNRILWSCVRRTNILPFDGEWDPIEMGKIKGLTKAALEAAHKSGEVVWAESGRNLWRDCYATLTRDRPGLWGAVTARAEAHVLRLAMIYTLLDVCTAIEAVHLQAALSLWEFCDQSAAYLFGQSTGDRVADVILSALKSASEGLTRSEIYSDIFHRNKPSNEIARALGLLDSFGLAKPTTEQTDGRTAERWTATDLTRTHTQETQETH